MSELYEKACAVKAASKHCFTTEEKNRALRTIADYLLHSKEMILQANREDVKESAAKGINGAMLDRLTLTEKRIADMADGVRQVADLPDPIGECMETIDRPNGLRIQKIRVPLGVIGMIYEARPNVTVDCAALTLKTGNGILLRGSASALCTNQALVRVIHDALTHSNLPKELVMLSDSRDHEAVQEMMRLNGIIDVLIPRGGASLIQNVVQNASVPVIQTGVGNCHIYIHADAKPDMAEAVVCNSKTSRPAVCNAAETLLVHEDWVPHLPHLLQTLKANGVTIHGCPKVCALDKDAVAAEESDYAEEYLSLDLAVKIVHNLDEALQHIDRYGTGHTEAILTENAQAAAIFLQQVDAACVNHNTSTRFTDGFQFGFGAEIGISTQKLHARGPLGLKELTSYKYVVYGNGQIRC